MITNHAGQRLRHRIPVEINTDKIDYWCERCQTRSCAVVLHRLPKAYEDKVTNANGELVVGIIRNGRATTVLLRRENQEISAAALFVDFVVWECR